MVYTSSPVLISHLKAAAPIRLIEGSVISPNNSGLGSPRKGKELSSSSESPRSPWGSSMGGGTEELVGPGPLKMSESSMCWTVVLLIGWGPVDGTGRSSSSTSSMKADCRRPDLAGRSTGCSWLVACVVFSEVAEGSVGNGHKGEVTGGDLSLTGTSTDVDDIRGDTGATLDDRNWNSRR